MLKEFDRQLNNLVQKCYPEAARMTVEQFLKYVEPLKRKISEFVVPEVDLEKGQLPFVIVITNNLVATEKAMSLVEREGNMGFIRMYPVETDSFKPIGGVNIPNQMAYLLLDIDRGKDTTNIAPNDALKIIQKRKRSPLTIDEGIAILTQYPDFLKKNNCFSLLGSRRCDKRVSALWIGDGRPRLGWCWAGTPHTWLGSASCDSRVGF
jgi:hypothetical protein